MKRAIANDILQQISNSQPPGRFLVQDNSHRDDGGNNNIDDDNSKTQGHNRNDGVDPQVLRMVWVQVSEEKAFEKVMHRLRDKKDKEKEKEKEPSSTTTTTTASEEKTSVESSPMPSVRQQVPQSRLGLLQCPNAASLGWKSGDNVEDRSNLPQSYEDTVKYLIGQTDVSSSMASDAGNFNMNKIPFLRSKTKAEDAKRRLGLLQSPDAISLGWGNDRKYLGIKDDINANVNNTHDDALKAEDTIMHIQANNSSLQEGAVVKFGGDHISSSKRPRLSPFIPSSTQAEAEMLDNTREEELSETEEPMKNYEPGVSLTETNQCYLSVTLDYEPSISSEDSSLRSQILTIAYLGKSTTSTTAEDISTVVGTISGKAQIDLLQTPEEEAFTDVKASQPTLSLDVFGYRISQHSCSSNNNEPIIINRPADWMNSLPISIICRDSNNETKQTLPITLRVRIQSIANSNKDNKSDECYYSAYPEESYQLNILPPNSLYPGNYTAAGTGVCTVLGPWKSTVDKVTKEIMDCSISDNKSKQTMDDKVQEPTSRKNHDRILLCGAKGVGKSTLLRYVTNRILSLQSPNNAGETSSKQIPSNRRVAILDLDCGQAELSPPGMLTLTILSRQLLSDPPVHMVCGGSCDHYGRQIQSSGEGDDQNISEEDAMKHEAAYFFGDITSKADPDTYIQMASQLVHRYNQLQELDGHSKLPLLVNTDGWVKGLGYEILSAIIGTVNPGHIVQINGSTKAKSFDMPLPHGGSQIHVIKSFDESLLPGIDDDTRSCRSMDSRGSSTGALLASASDHRVHRLCTYFLGGYNKMMSLRSRIPGEENVSISFHKERALYDPSNIIGLTLASMLPYAVPFHAVKLYPPPGLLDSVSELRPRWGLRGDVACNDVIGSLNGSIVGLCSTDLVDAPFVNCNAGIGVPTLNCVGLGIVRSVDYNRKLFFVLTPVHPRLLASVTSFVGGNINLPLECVYRGVHSDSFPYLSCGHSITNTTLGADVMKSRNHSRGK